MYVINYIFHTFMMLQTRVNISLFLGGFTLLISRLDQIW